MCHLLLWRYWKTPVGVFKCLNSPSATNIPAFGTKEQHIPVHVQHFKTDGYTRGRPSSCWDSRQLFPSTVNGLDLFLCLPEAACCACGIC